MRPVPSCMRLEPSCLHPAPQLHAPSCNQLGLRVSWACGRTTRKDTAAGNGSAGKRGKARASPQALCVRGERVEWGRLLPAASCRGSQVRGMHHGGQAGAGPRGRGEMTGRCQLVRWPRRLTAERLAASAANRATRHTLRRRPGCGARLAGNGRVGATNARSQMGRGWVAVRRGAPAWTRSPRRRTQPTPARPGCLGAHGANRGCVVVGGWGAVGWGRN